MIYYFKYLCVMNCINLPYMLMVFGIGNLKIIIVYAKVWYELLQFR